MHHTAITALLPRRTVLTSAPRRSSPSRRPSGSCRPRPSARRSSRCWSRPSRSSPACAARRKERSGEARAVGPALVERVDDGSSLARAERSHSLDPRPREEEEQGEGGVGATTTTIPRATRRDTTCLHVDAEHGVLLYLQAVHTVFTLGGATFLHWAAGGKNSSTGCGCSLTCRPPVLLFFEFLHCGSSRS